MNRHQRRLPPDHVYTHIDVTSAKAEEKALMRDLRVRSVALDYARSNKFDLFTALMSRFSESSVLTSESELQRAYSLFYRQVRIDSAEDHAVNQRQWTPGMDVPLLVRVEPYNRSETLFKELISEVVEIEKAQVRERAYPPGITNRR